ncbi:hypothetical protein ACU6RQ_17980 [Zobellella denitrificans]
MKVFLSYTVRDGFINEGLLGVIEKKLKNVCDIYIDALHNKSTSPQDEVISQLKSSDAVIQIVTPLINESRWASLEVKVAEENKLPTYLVNYIDSKPEHLISCLVDVIKSNKRLQATTNRCTICTTGASTNHGTNPALAGCA